MNFIKNYIDKRVEEANENLRLKVVSSLRAEVEKICKEMVSELFSNKKDTKIRRHLWDIDFVKTIRGEIKAYSIDAILNSSESIAQRKANEIILGEAFLDKLVKRLKDKQL